MNLFSPRKLISRIDQVSGGGGTDKSVSCPEHTLSAHPSATRPMINGSIPAFVKVCCTPRPWYLIADRESTPFANRESCERDSDRKLVHHRSNDCRLFSKIFPGKLFYVRGEPFCFVDCARIFACRFEFFR